MAEEEEDVVSDVEDNLEGVATTNNGEATTDFVVLKQESAVDLEDVANIFDTEEATNAEEFKEGEEAGLCPIMEEGEEEEFIEGMEEVEYEMGEEELEGEEIFMEEGEEVVEAQPHVEVDTMSGKSDATSRDIEVKEVGPQDRYKMLSSTEVGGDFLRRDDIFGTVHRPFGIVMDDLGGDMGEEEEAESEELEKTSSTVEEAEEYLDREPYYELYRSLVKEYPMLRMKNNFLQRKMAEYFKRRKMEHVLRESERVGDAQVKYYRKLDTLWELRNTSNMQRSAITAELNDMKELRDKQVTCVVENFEAMQNREREIGKGLIFTKTAKEIPEKLLDRLLKNQRTKSKEILEMRLCFIKLRNNIEELTAAIKAMDKIGEDHTLIDYEQLKMENQNHADKIEERDEELSKLRTKCAAAIQTLAHLREKSSSTDIDILEMNDKLDEVEMERNDWREKVNSLKKERDNLRCHIVKLQEDSGLLTKPKLLLDMQDTLEQIEACKSEIQRINATYSQKAKALEAIKRNIEEEKEYFHPERKVVHKPKVWKGKRRLIYPELEKFNTKDFKK
ncbi:hypothetical protein Trydic_g3302 [Trypoxylus dichotomus]